MVEVYRPDILARGHCSFVGQHVGAGSGGITD